MTHFEFLLLLLAMSGLVVTDFWILFRHGALERRIVELEDWVGSLSIEFEHRDFF